MTRIAVWVLLLTAACSSSKTTRLELSPAPAGDVAPLVTAELERTQSANRTLLVYIGAEWCEPCRRFHDAAASGQLDDAFSDLRLLVFDADRDGERLVAAGYNGTMIPLFAVPRPDGTASGRQIEGAVKGETALATITPRLRALLDGR